MPPAFQPKAMPKPIAKPAARPVSKPASSGIVTPTAPTYSSILQPGKITGVTASKGKWGMPNFSVQREPSTLAEPFKMTAQQASMGDAGKELTKRATEAGPSTWAQIQMQQNALQQQNALNDATQQAAGQNAQAQAQLAMRGGMGSGARERLASGSAWNQMAASQGIRNQGNQNALNIGIADQEQKNGMLGQAAGLETGMSQFNVGQANTAGGMNVQNAVGDVRGRGDFEMQRYGQQMADVGAQRNANAMKSMAPKERDLFWNINDPFNFTKATKGPV